MSTHNPPQPFDQPPWPPAPHTQSATPAYAGHTTYGSPPPRPPRRRRWLIPAVIAVLAAGAGAGAAGYALLSGGDGQPTGGATTPAAGPGAGTPTLAKCSDVFRIGQTIDDAKGQAGCLDPDSGMQIIGSFRCNDGRHLYQVDAATGAAEGWGFGGEVYKATKEAASDPAYGKAYDACHS